MIKSQVSTMGHIYIYIIYISYIYIIYISYIYHIYIYHIYIYICISYIYIYIIYIYHIYIYHIYKIYISYIYLSSGILVIAHKRQGNPTFLSRSLRHLLPSHPCGLWPCPALLLRNPKRMAKRSNNTINLGSKIRVLPGGCGFCMISIFPTFWGFSKDDVKLRPPNSARKVWWHLMTWVYASVSGQYPVWGLFCHLHSLYLLI